jgi:hypothetical protein
LLMRAAQVRSADVRTYADVSGVRRCVAVRTRN